MQSLSIVIPGLFLGLYLWRWMQARIELKKLSLARLDEIQIVDVRSLDEYRSAHFPGSINIPLHLLSREAERLNKDRAVVLCCASGARSGSARSLLQKKGFKSVANVGSWKNLERIKWASK